MSTRLGITDTQATVLRSIAWQEVGTAAEIADHTRLPKATTHSAITSLVKYGLARRLGTAFAGGPTYALTLEGAEALVALRTTTPDTEETQP